MTKDITARNERLRHMKAIALLGMERDGWVRAECPLFHDDPESKKKGLKEIKRLGDAISTRVESLLALEKGLTGFSLVLGRVPCEAEAVVLALLVVARLDVNAHREFRSVGDLATVAASRDVEVAMQIRGMFRASDGNIFPLVVLTGTGVALDEMHVRVREGVLNRILGLQPDVTTELLSEMEIPELRRRR